jgi:hypothetical protein
MQVFSKQVFSFCYHGRRCRWTTLLRGSSDAASAAASPPASAPDADSGGAQNPAFLRHNPLREEPQRRLERSEGMTVPLPILGEGELFVFKAEFRVSVTRDHANQPDYALDETFGLNGSGGSEDREEVERFSSDCSMHASTLWLSKPERGPEFVGAPTKEARDETKKSLLEDFWHLKNCQMLIWWKILSCTRKEIV